MRHARSDYDHIQDPTGKIGQDEPVFVIRATDRAAPATLRQWAFVNNRLGGDQGMSLLVAQWADEMERWQQENPGKVKLADVPESVLLEAQRTRMASSAERYLAPENRAGKAYKPETIAAGSVAGLAPTERADLAGAPTDLSTGDRSTGDRSIVDPSIDKSIVHAGVGAEARAIGDPNDRLIDDANAAGHRSFPESSR